jgi:hypothetical protein
MCASLMWLAGMRVREAADVAAVRAPDPDA